MSTETKRIRAVFETDTSQYNSSMQGINKQMKMYQSEVKQASTDTKNFGKNADSLAKTSEGLSKQIDLNKQKLKLYEDAMAKSNTKVQDGVSKRKELERQLTSNKTKYDEIVKAEGKNSEQAKALKESINNLNKEYKNNEKFIDNNIKKCADYQTSINKTKTDMSNLEGELKKTNKVIQEHSNKWNIASQKLSVFSEKSKNVGSGLNTVGNGILAVTVPMAAGIGAVTKQFMDFETQLTKVNTIADYSKVSFDDIKNGVIKLSKETGMSTTDLNEALYEALSASVDTADAIGFLGQATKLAKGGFTSTTNAVDILTTVLNAYGLEAKETSKISDVLIQTQNLGKTSVDQLSSALGKVIPTAKAANVNFEQIGAAMALMTSKGISTNESVTYLNSAINELSKSGTKASDALKNATGKSFQEVMASGESLGNVMVKLDEYAKASGLSLNDMFGSVEAGKSALTLATNNGKEFNETLKTMQDSAGSTEEAYKKMMSTKSENLNVALNKVKLSFMKLGEAAVPIVDDIADIISKLAEFIENLSDEQIDSIVNFVKWGVVIGGATKLTGGFVSGVGNIAGGLSKLTGLLGKTTTATASVGGAVKVAATGTSFLTKAVKIGSLALNPYALAIAGVTVGAVALGKKLSEEVVPEVDLFTNTINKAADGTVTGTTKISEATKSAVGAYMELSDKAEKELLNLKFSNEKVTSEISSSMVSSYRSMGEQVINELNSNYEKQVNLLVSHFNAENETGAQQRAQAEELLKNHNQKKIDEINNSNARIQEILTLASQQNRELNQSEYDEISRIQASQKEFAIKTLSETEKESAIILGRIKEYDGRMTAEIAGEHVRLLEEQRVKSIDQANLEYAEKVNVINQMNEEVLLASGTTKDALIADAENQRNEIVANANSIKKDGIDVLREAFPELARQVNESNGEILRGWEAIKKKFERPIEAKIKVIEEYQRSNYSVTRPMNQGMNQDNGRMTAPQTRGISPASLSATPDYAALNPSPMMRSAIPQKSFDYSRVENMLDSFSNQLSNLTNTVNVFIDGKQLSRETGVYTDEELGRLETINNFGFSK